MGNGISVDQGNYTTYGKRDVGELEGQGQPNWSSPEEELAEAFKTQKPEPQLSSDQKPHT